MRSSKGSDRRGRGSTDVAPLRRDPGRPADRRPDSYRIAVAIAETDGVAIDVPRIAALAQEGDEFAMGDLYIEFFERVRRYLVVTLKNDDDAQEVAQDVFERALERIDRYDASRGSFGTWLFQIVSSMALDHLRRAQRRPEAGERRLPAEDVSHVDQGAALVEQLDPGSGLRTLVRALPDGERRAVTLRFVFGFSAVEIGDVLGCSDDAVRHLQCRGLKKLGRSLREAAVVA